MRTKFERRSGIKTAKAFTLVELVVILSVVAILAAVAAPVFGRVRKRLYEAACANNLKQIGGSFLLYVQDNDGFYPDRRDLKSTLPAGYKPWGGWPVSDPRVGWCAFALQLYSPAFEKWACPGTIHSSLRKLPQVNQPLWSAPNAFSTTYWMWRFDQMGPEVSLDNFWGKHENEALADLRQLNNPVIGNPSGPNQIELTTDPYFPGNATGVSDKLRGLSPHLEGYNRLFLDEHVEFVNGSSNSL